MRRCLRAESEPSSEFAERNVACNVFAEVASIGLLTSSGKQQSVIQLINLPSTENVFGMQYELLTLSSSCLKHMTERA